MNLSKSILQLSFHVPPMDEFTTRKFLMKEEIEGMLLDCKWKTERNLCTRDVDKFYSDPLYNVGEYFHHVKWFILLQPQLWTQLLL